MIKKNFSLLVVISLIFYLASYYYAYGRLSNLFSLKVKSFKKGYIQYQCLQETLFCGGWADRLEGLMSTYAFSLLTKRYFLIKINKKCDIRNILEPNEIDWNHEKVTTNLTSRELHLNWNFSYYKIFEKNISLFTDLSDIDLIKVNAGMMYASTLHKNENLKENIRELGYEPSKFQISYQFYNWYKTIFKLKEKLEQKYQDLLKQVKPTKDAKLICCQVRKGDFKQRDRRKKNFERDFWDFVSKNFLTSKDSAKYRIFVTSDLEHVKQDAKNFFKNNEVFFNPNSSVHIDFELKDNDCLNMEKVLFDFHFMQNCDIGLISESGFGILALWNRPDPFKDLYVYREIHQLSQKQRDNLPPNSDNYTFLKFDNPNAFSFL